MLTTSRRTILVLLTIGTLAFTSTAVASAAETPAVPAPTGRHHVGMKTLHLVDPRRVDPWVPESGNRELMLSLWYPTLQRRGTPAPYMTPAVSKLTLDNFFPGADPTSFSVLRTNAIADARPAPSPHGLPLVLLSPGFSLSRSTLTGLAEDLASKGYLVAAIDHNYEAAGIEFPGGRVTTCVACAIAEPGTVDQDKKFAQLVRGRAADASFVIDQLTRGGLVDRSKIGMAGHSIGGASALEAMATDRRIKAGVDIDGTLFTDRALGKPFLFLGAKDGSPERAQDATWDRTWPKLTGYRRSVNLPRGGHDSATDLVWIFDAYEVRGLFPPALANELFGSLPGERALQVNRAYVGAFFDTQLRGGRTKLLDGPSSAYPEAEFDRSHR